MIDDLKRRWLELGKIPSSRLTYSQIEEQFNLAQALTALLSPELYDNLNAHRAKCLELMRNSKIKVTQPTKWSTTGYAIMRAKRKRHLSWREIELTPDITFTVSNELIGHIIPVNYTKALKKMIQLQGKLLLQLEGPWKRH